MSSERKLSFFVLQVPPFYRSEPSAAWFTECPLVMQTNNKQQHASEVSSSSPAFRCSSAAHRGTLMEPSLHGRASGSDLSCALQAPIVNNSDMTTCRTGSWGREGERRGLARAEFGVTLEHAWAPQVTAIPRVCNRVPS
jgi:hypothetical protein